MANSNPILLFMRKKAEQKLLTEMAMQTRNSINTNGASITRAIMLAVLAKSNLHWKIHHAQVTLL